MKKPVFVIEDDDDEESPAAVEEEDPSRCTADEEKRLPLLQHDQPRKSLLSVWLCCCRRKDRGSRCVLM